MLGEQTAARVPVAGRMNRAKSQVVVRAPAVRKFFYGVFGPRAFGPLYSA